MLTADDDCSSVLQEVRGFIACSRRSDSGVRREGGQREKNKEEKRERERGGRRLSPLPNPLVIFFCSHLFALSPLSERLELAREFRK